MWQTHSFTVGWCLHEGAMAYNLYSERDEGRRKKEKEKKRGKKNETKKGWSHTKHIYSTYTLLWGFRAAKTEKKRCWLRFTLKSQALHFSVNVQKLRCLVSMAETLNTACSLCLLGHNVAFADSSGSYHMTPFQKKTTGISLSYQCRTQHG